MGALELTSELVRPVRRARRVGITLGILSAAVFTLTACTGDAPEVSGGGTGSTLPEATEAAPSGTDSVGEESAEDPASVELVDLPGCDVIERQIATGLDQLELAAEEDHTAEHAMDSSYKSCVWVTELHEDLRNADVNTLMDALHTGTLSLAINIAPDPLSQEDAAEVGFFFHDLRAEQVDGFVFAPEDTDLSEPLGMMGITISVDNIDVTWAGGTYFDGRGDQIAEMFNKDWGVDAAATVHRLIWD